MWEVGYRENQPQINSDVFRLGKLLEYPEIMTQGETLEYLEENIKDAYMLIAIDDVLGPC